MKKIVTTIALIMALGLTAFASHVERSAPLACSEGRHRVLADKGTPPMRAIASHGVVARDSHLN
ncbi:MAG: hypothetical protein DMF64_07945 [Acidobacteria bacterium]|nr:MAG: hypothetical protein DMF64_07945 [Acidobacteriota bacterium]